MRMVEVIERWPSVKIPASLYGYFCGGEVDTVDDYSSPGKVEFASNLQSATTTGTAYKIPLSPGGREYLMKRAIPNGIDVATDNQDGKLLRQLRKLEQMLSNG